MYVSSGCAYRDRDFLTSPFFPWNLPYSVSLLACDFVRCRYMVFSCLFLAAYVAV
jgi:hypothetical protein